MPDDQIEENEMGGAYSKYGELKRYTEGFGGKTLGKIALGRPRSRWEDNIKMDIREMGKRHGLD
jgi:hypothetical protein